MSGSHQPQSGQQGGLAGMIQAAKQQQAGLQAPVMPQGNPAMGHPEMQAMLQRLAGARQ